MSRTPLTTLLVANRGEIACRVMRTAKAMGLTTVAVHSATDRDARHSREADIRVDLGGTKAAESYLLVDKLLAAAKASGAQAIHPGYGFLSENAGFARAIEQAGLIFLGPPASAIDAMGSKSAAKALMEAAGVPLVSGAVGPFDGQVAVVTGGARGIGKAIANAFAERGATLALLDLNQADLDATRAELLPQEPPLRRGRVWPGKRSSFHSQTLAAWLNVP